MATNHRSMKTARRLWAAGALGVLIGSFALPSTAQTRCISATEDLIPIMDMGSSQYLGLDGGLYGGGSNEIPAAHLDLGVQLAGQIMPLDSQGSPSSEGSIVILALGVSNTLLEFNTFKDLAERGSDINPAVALVNGAVGGAELEVWAESRRPWDEVTRTIQQEGFSEQQVQVVWIKMPSKARGTPDLTNYEAELEMLTGVIREVPRYFPNTRLAFVSSRAYGGFGGRLGEPASYQHGFTVREAIVGQIAGTGDLNPDADRGPVAAPWLAWGPYLWANGTSPRSDGLAYECSDFENDGIHPAAGAQLKIAALLLEHFSSHPTTRSWFLDPNAPDGSATSGAIGTTDTTVTTPDLGPETTNNETSSNGQADGPLPASPSGLIWILAGLGALAIGLGAVLSLRRRR